MAHRRRLTIAGWSIAAVAESVSGPLRLAVSLFLCTLLLGCGNTNRDEREADVLPGRSRPLLAHDWPHPREYQFEATRFTPPIPQDLLITATSGLRAYVATDAREGVVRVTAALPLGRIYEESGEQGAAGVIVQTLRQLGPPATRRVIAPRLQRLATTLRVEEGIDVTTVSVESLAEDWQQALSAVIDLLREFDVDDASVRTYRTGLGYGSHTARVEIVGFRPEVELARLVSGYPLAPPEAGLSVESTAVRDLAARTLRPDRIVMGIGGDVPREEVERALEQLSRNWPTASEPLRRAAFVERSPTSRFHTIESDTLQGWIAMGRLLPPVPVEDRPALAVLAEILGIRLNIATREMRGLANRAIFVLPEAADGAGLMRVLTGGRLEAVAPLVKYSTDEVQRLWDPAKVVDPEELDRAKGILVLGRWQVSLDGPREASSTLAIQTVRHGDVRGLLDWPAAVERVTVEQVTSAARYLSDSEWITVMEGRIESIREARHPRWPFTLPDVGFTADQ